MAKIWPVYEGRISTIGEPWVEMPLNDAVRVLQLEPRFFLADLARAVRFGNEEQNLTWAGYRHVVVEVDDAEAGPDWQPGVYRSPLDPSKAFYRLLEWRIEKRVGPDWRVKIENGSVMLTATTRYGRGSRFGRMLPPILGREKIAKESERMLRGRFLKAASQTGYTFDFAMIRKRGLLREPIFRSACPGELSGRQGTSEA